MKIEFFKQRHLLMYLSSKSKLQIRKICFRLVGPSNDNWYNSSPGLKPRIIFECLFIRVFQYLKCGQVNQAIFDEKILETEID